MTTTISFDDYSKIDLRIGTITEVFDFNEAHKPAYKLTIDFGNVFAISATITHFIE